MNLSEEQAIFAQQTAMLITYIFSQNYKCTFGETYRTSEQAQIYAKEGKGIADSLHCKRLAIDLNLFNLNGTYLTDAKDYEIFGEWWEKLDRQNRWGGNFLKYGGHIVDLDHFERHI